MTEPLYLSAKEAAAELGVALPTLYAYVSRGLIRSQARDGSRRRLYAAADVRALTQRKAPEARPDPALDWGAPVMESAITLIADGGLYYRGRDAMRLAETAGLETVATLLWDAQGDPFADPPPPPPPLFDRVAGEIASLPPVDRLQVLLPIAGAADPRAVNRSPEGLARTGARILRLSAAILADCPVSADPLHLALARAWGVGAGRAGLIRAALVACADHELNASTFTVRCAASTGIGAYGAVQAGIAALRGPRHGGMTERVQALLPDLLAASDPVAAVAARLARGEDLPGFGHPLYPKGDVRARMLMKLMRQALPGDPVLARAGAVVDAAIDLAERAPTVDWALALLADRLDLPTAAPLSIFTLGRTAGWIAHIIEQVQSGRLIRPRAHYIGPRP